MSRKPNYTPYPGDSDGSKAAGYVLLHNGSGVTKDNLSALEKLLKEKDPTNPLYEILVGCEQGLPKYDHDELWLYSFWHTSGEDAQEHSTFRFFADVGLPGKKPWNVAVYHVYKDGQVTGWTYDQPNVEI
ncbi:hypothetical protein C8J57DRAFT_352941 [Mycena rebaudengoi]|nr:hypothetical protein C8J57DRAFT_1401328 [Mycena rebaudengoi]KAJ7267925.1 hypothetical protein C8J57DRAFT_1469313 [Mycena rebaudengoi]KAJ7267943.1 hypothetical protein C8J57DRAFT_352941 [Mycena rebaudengoi]